MRRQLCDTANWRRGRETTEAGLSRSRGAATGWRVPELTLCILESSLTLPGGKELAPGEAHGHGQSRDALGTKARYQEADEGSRLRYQATWNFKVAGEECKCGLFK